MRLWKSTEPDPGGLFQVAVTMLDEPPTPGTWVPATDADLEAYEDGLEAREQAQVAAERPPVPSGYSATQRAIFERLGPLVGTEAATALADLLGHDHGDGKKPKKEKG